MTESFIVFHQKSRYQKYLAPPCGSEDQPQLRDASAPQAVDSSTLRMLSTESGGPA